MLNSRGLEASFLGPRLIDSFATPRTLHLVPARNLLHLSATLRTLHSVSHRVEEHHGEDKNTSSYKKGSHIRPFRFAPVIKSLNRIYLLSLYAFLYQ